MKTKKYPFWSLLIVLISSFTLSNCARENSISEETEKDIITVSAHAVNADIVVSPSGDTSGVTDFNSIQAAIAALPSGGVLLLESGTFYINGSIFSDGFEGTIRGRGKNKTEVIGVGSNTNTFNGDEFFFFLEPSGHLEVSHMSLSLVDGFQDNAFNPNLGPFIFVQLSTDGTDTNFDNLKLTGTDAVAGSPPFFLTQPLFGIIVQGDGSTFPVFTSGGHHMLTNSEFAKQGIQATVYQGFSGANIEVNNNSYTEVKQTNYRFMEGSSVKIANNYMETITFGAIVVTQEFVTVPGDPNKVLIEGNVVKTAGFLPIEIGPIPAGAANFELLIRKNTVTNLGFDPVGFGFPNLAGIAIFSGNDDALVLNNIVNGEAWYGILNETNNSTFIGNNLQGISTSNSDYFINGDNNTLVGIGNSTIIDLGTNNISTGMQMLDGASMGEDIKAAMQKRKELLEAYDNFY